MVPIQRVITRSPITGIFIKPRAFMIKAVRPPSRQTATVVKWKSITAIYLNLVSIKENLMWPLNILIKSLTADMKCHLEKKHALIGKPMPAIKPMTNKPLLARIELIKLLSRPWIKSGKSTNLTTATAGIRPNTTTTEMELQKTEKLREDKLFIRSLPK